MRYGHKHSTRPRALRALGPRAVFEPYRTLSALLGRCLQHRGGEPEQAKGADGMQLFALDCIAHIVDAEMD